MQMALRWRQGCLAAPSIMPLLLPAAFMLPLIAQVLGFARPEGDNKRESAGAETGAALQNGLGLMQWLIVAAFVLYFVSYAVDVHQCACQDEQDAETVRPLNPFLLSCLMLPTYPPNTHATHMTTVQCMAVLGLVLAMYITLSCPSLAELV